MATIQAPTDEKVYTIRRFLGVNEAEEGEATLKIGEASTIRNFRVTAGGALQKRPGSLNVAGLGTVYDTSVDTTAPTVLFRFTTTSPSITVYSGVTVNSMGAISTTGSATTMTSDNAESCVGKYYTADGKFWQFAGVSVLDSELMSGEDYAASSTRSAPQAMWWEFYPVTAVVSGTASIRALWSGIVNGNEVVCAVCGGFLFELTLTDGVWSKTECGTLTDAEPTSLFGFSDKLYVLNGTQYKVWDGTTLSDVTGYRPMVTVSTPPAGGGTELEQVNKLNGTRRARYSPTGTDTVFYLPEKPVATIDYVKNVATGQSITGWTGDTTNGKLTFTSAPAEGVNTIEIGWTVSTSYADTVRHMRFSELFNGWQDSRVFLFGDGTNQAIYSGLTYDGTPSAEYFPDLNVLRVGDENTPITDMIRNYSKLLAFKADSTWSIGYDTLTLEDGRTIPGFYIKPVNRDVGNIAPGQAVLVGNRPRTLDDRAIIEWATGRGGYITADERNAERVSQRVSRTIQTFDLKTARAFYDKVHHEYYVIGANGNVLVHNTDADAWYSYTGLNATCMIVYKDEVYYGTDTGWLVHLSTDYTGDNGEPIDCLWESGAMDFGQDFKRKYSAMLWVGIKPEAGAALLVSAKTDRKTDFADYAAEGGNEGAVPDVDRVKLKAKKFTYYELTLKSDSADTKATVVGADIRVRGTGYAK